MTEQEAKTKWCPFVRSTVVGADDAGKWQCLSSRDAAQMVAVGDAKVMTHNCIGSACMTWRWFEAEPVIMNDGYCGLAGRPA